MNINFMNFISTFINSSLTVHCASGIVPGAKHSELISKPLSHSIVAYRAGNKAQQTGGENKTSRSHEAG